MDLHPSMSYRISTLEIEQAAIRAERARIAAEHADQIVRRDGILRRMFPRRQTGRAATAAAPAVETAAVPASAAAPAIAPAATPAPAAAPAVEPAAQVASASDETRERELVGCVSHAA
ncbi:hypothetical protein [Microbacterium sp. USTB-Y]|uniref:hypothetical protein n=1 Tax=Microbacterium sp. USTB-Y TaxID=2823692 RepID=UPI00203E3FE3|nr:hypothetical protein [Microbacterium sp. USTB-Y]